MASVSVRFYGSLNDFLPPPRRQSTLVCTPNESPSVKDLVESLGVPHPEIDLLIVQGQSVDFGYRVRDGDRVAVYPLIREFDLTTMIRLAPPCQAEPRFIADVHLGRLAAYLRLAGFDTTYRNDRRVGSSFGNDGHGHTIVLGDPQRDVRPGAVGHELDGRDAVEDLTEVLPGLDLRG